MFRLFFRTYMTALPHSLTRDELTPTGSAAVEEHLAALANIANATPLD